MRTLTILAGTLTGILVISTALPASAQLAGTLGGAVSTGVNATVDTGRTTDAVAHTTTAAATAVVNGTQRAADYAVGQRMTASGLTLATRAQVQTGLVVRDTRGQRIGTVSRTDANTAIVVSGNRQYRVPLTALYHRTTGAASSAASGLVSAIPRARLSTQVSAQAQASSAAQAGR